MYLARDLGGLLENDLKLYETTSATDFVNVLAAGKDDGVTLTFDEV